LDNEGGGRLNVLALCAGYGGLELGLERVFDRVKTVCYVEGEAFAAQHLVKKMEEGAIHEAAIWSNVRTFNGEPWRGKVDIITGGFPCQPYSSAGKQLADKDPRDLWPDFVRIVGEVRPGFLFFENVPGIVKWRLNQIVLDLDKLGYSCAWCVVAASDVGALHRRKRWFLLAVRNDTDADNTGKRRGLRTIQQKDRDNVSGLCSNVSHTYGLGWDSLKPQAWGGEYDVKGSCCSISDTNSERIQRVRRFDGKTPEIKQTKRHLNPSDKWGGRFDSWWEVEPSMGRLVDGSSDWVDKLRILGNGVVPQQAAYALQILGERLAWGMVENRTPKD
jgi:DNA (cytosine-5)-methyltransferase 1